MSLPPDHSKNPFDAVANESNTEQSAVSQEASFPQPEQEQPAPVQPPVTEEAAVGGQPHGLPKDMGQRDAEARLKNAHTTPTDAASEKNLEGGMEFIQQLVERGTNNGEVVSEIVAKAPPYMREVAAKLAEREIMAQGRDPSETAAERDARVAAEQQQMTTAIAGIAGLGAAMAGVAGLGAAMAGVAGTMRNMLTPQQQHEVTQLGRRMQGSITGFNDFGPGVNDGILENALDESLVMAKTFPNKTFPNRVRGEQGISV